jgi:DNA-binding CsgD family transcriptional regulator
MKKKLFYHLFFAIACAVLFYQNSAGASTVLTNIKNFSKKEYGAANQNWSVAASSNGFMYFANHSGLLEFDGTSWKLYELPNQTILRSVKIASDSVIYTGGYRELGYWEREKNGNLHYYSLNELAGENLSQNDEFWTICILNDEVYFHSFSKILRYSNDTISRVELPGFSNTMNRVGDHILVGIRDYGIFAIESGKAEPFLLDEKIINLRTSFLLPYNNSQLLIGTGSDGIFLWDGENLRRWNAAWTDYFKNNEVNRAHIDPDGKLIIGTIVDGVSVFDSNEQRVAAYNTSNGLQNNTVLGITTDIYGNIWLALDSGIDFISNHNNKGIEIENIAGIGSIYDAALFEGSIYLGTNRGLFSRQIDDKNSAYQLISDANEQVWDCSVFNNQLFIGFNQGILNIQNGRNRLISNQAGGFSLKEDPFVPGRLVESTYTSMVIMEKVNNEYRQTGIIKGFYDLIRFIEFDHLGNLWASHMHRGIYKLQLNNQRDSVLNLEYYGENSAFKKDHSIHVFKVENRIVFTTAEKLFTYNDLEDTIVPYTQLNEQLGHFASAHRIVAAPDQHYWFITEEKLGLFQITDFDVKLIRSVPMQVFHPFEMVDDFENIFTVSATEAIICLENGIAHVNASQIDIPSEITNYSPALREIVLTNKQGNQRILQGELSSIRVKANFNNLFLRYAFPFYTIQPVYFQSFLEGIDQTWSGAKAEPLFTFDRLPPGDYTLHIKAVDAWENESTEHSIEIEILPPWYLTAYARVGYVLLFFVVLAGLQMQAIRRTQKKERMRLLRREQELIRLRNEKLRNEVEHKSKELANSTMSIIKKNEFLLKLKQTLSRHKEQLGSRYPDKYYNSLTKKIDENIASQDDWHLFETNFVRAHEQFLHKIKAQFPDLTPKDLRLCAFLRMNLSSKEIAPLLGISVRAVENHRYRLRKKMNLEHDDNLIDMILKL